ncbi:MAG: DUF547 domain-containing protein [Candidatus Methylacidiphilales bacterium]
MKIIFLWIKTIVLCSASSWGQGAPNSLPHAVDAAPSAFTGLLSKYARPDGVHYEAWRANEADIEALQEVVGFYASHLPPENKQAALAWHLNAYNAWILHHVLKKYPTPGPLDGNPLFFKMESIIISGEKTSFDHLEKKRILAVYQDPRLHFAVNCASESCPPLHTQPFIGDTLQDDLDRLTRAFINTNPQGVVAGQGEVGLSKIFDWYADDFGGRNQLIAYLNRYRDQTVPANARVRFLDYSWKLNEVK